MAKSQWLSLLNHMDTGNMDYKHCTLKFPFTLFIKLYAHNTLSNKKWFKKFIVTIHHSASSAANAFYIYIFLQNGTEFNKNITYCDAETISKMWREFMSKITITPDAMLQKPQ